MAEADKFEKLRQKNFPWCTLLLVLAATTCHLCVLVGNLKTARTLEELGKSTGGWSTVGGGIARSLQVELDQRMEDVSTQLLDSLSHVGVVQETMGAVLSMVGVQTDGLLQPSSTPSNRSLATLQYSHIEGRNLTEVVAKLSPMVTSAVHNALTSMTNEVSELVVQLFEKLKPALQQVGQWIVKFGDKIQSGLSAFSVSVDHVQKLLDQVMSKLRAGGGNLDDLLHETFNLFDVSNTGAVTAQDVRDVSKLYSITALQGNLSNKLLEKYDEDGSGGLSMQELRLLVDDPAIPDSMTKILRTYSKRLAEVAGVLASARQRDEVAVAVSEYIELACAKNQTKVSWIVDRLGNGSLPIEFTGDVLVELCLAQDNPGKLTTSDVGAAVVGKLLDEHRDRALQALELLSNSTYWLAEGFEAADQPVCVKRVAEWVAGASSLKDANGSQVLAELGGSLAHRLVRGAPLETDALRDLPMILESQCEADMMDVLTARRLRAGSQSTSETSQLLLGQLFGDGSATGTGPPTAAERAVRQGVPARPETLEFAKWLSFNASSTAKGLQDMCFNHSSASSDAADSIASQIQGVVSQIKGFIDLMMRYSTPSAIDQLEDQIVDFTENALRDVQRVIEKRVSDVVMKSGGDVAAAVEHAAHKAGEKLGSAIASVVSSPVAQALKEPMEDIVGEMVNNSKVAHDLGDRLGSEMSEAVSNLTAEVIGDKTGDLLEDLVERALSKGSDVLEAVSGAADSRESGDHERSLYAGASVDPSPALRRLQERVRERRQASLLQKQASAAGGAAKAAAGGLPEALGKLPAALSGAWQGLVSLLRSLANLLPTSVEALKAARREVSRLHSQMGNTFSTFEARGPAIFEQAAFYWRIVWCAYFSVLLPLSILMMYYAMWAGGYFGGPEVIHEEAGPPPARTCSERLWACFGACSVCSQKYHDTQLCFWSAVLLMEVAALVIFVVTILLCILGGVKMFLVQGCGEVYVLHDEAVCTEALVNVRRFMDTFLLDESMSAMNGIELDKACSQYNLLTCDMIAARMKSSTLLTTVFSFLATLFSLQLIIDSAVMHEQATFRRLAATVSEGAIAQATASSS